MACEVIFNSKIEANYHPVQCGGIGWAGATTCSPGYFCLYSNGWWYGCEPAPVPARDQAPCGQCGGIGCTGLTICSPGYCCVVVTDHFWQCTPIPFPPPSATSTFIITSLISSLNIVQGVNLLEHALEAKYP